MKTLIAAAIILGVLATVQAVAVVEPICPRHFELMERENGSCVCECVERRCPTSNLVFDSDLCRCVCDPSRCEYGVVNMRTCKCRNVPDPVRPGSCIGPEKMGCSMFDTEEECTKYRCIWREEPRDGPRDNFGGYYGGYYGGRG